MNLTMLVRQLDSGQVEASVLELPGYRIEASSRDLAIERLRSTLIDGFQGTELFPFEIPVEMPVKVGNPWVKLFGLFKDDSYFDEVMDIIQSERAAFGDEEIDPAYYS